MLRPILLCLSLGTALFGQGIVQFSAGQLQCGAVKRSTNMVQTYCYAPKNILVHNSIETLLDETQGPISGTALIVTFQWEGDDVLWKFDLTGAVITYEINYNIRDILAGALTVVYGTPLAGTGCPLLNTGAPSFWFVNDTQTCTSVWASNIGNWLTCCG